MRIARVALLGAVAIFVTRPLHAQVTFLQNDSYTTGAVSCHVGIGLFEGLGAKFTASPGQYPYTIDRIRVFGCGGEDALYGLQIFEDNGPGPTPGTLLWTSQFVYQLQGTNVFNDIVVSSEPLPPPPITSGSVRVFLINQNLVPSPFGFGSDTNGIQAQRNFLFSDTAVWSFAENGGVTGDWILRLGIAVSASADVSVTITDGQSAAVPGQALTYTITASNAGPDPVVGARVQAPLPAGLQVATWTCTATTGSSCTATGSGGINDFVGLLSTGTATYTLSATINPAATGSLTNTATISLAAGATDPIPANNTASDTDTLTPRTDLAIAVSDSPDPVAPGGTLTYTIQVSNLGPSTSTGRTVVDTLPAGVSFVSSNPAGPTCTVGGSVVTCVLGTLGPTASQTVTVVTTVNTSSGSLSTTASVTGNETDLVSANNTDTETTTVSAVPLGPRFYTLTPCRVVDTRTGSGAPIGGPPLEAQNPRPLTIAGRCNVPPTARAVSLNVTVTQPGADGNLRLFPGGLSVPLISTLNYSTGQTRANNAVIPLSASGEIIAFAGQATGTTVQLIVDVNGYVE